MSRRPPCPIPATQGRPHLMSLHAKLGAAVTLTWALLAAGLAILWWSRGAQRLLGPRRLKAVYQVHRWAGGGPATGLVE